MRNRNNKIALITGVGRSSGIGAALCRAFADQGVDIFFTYWRAYDRALFPESKDSDPLNLAVELRQRNIRVGSEELDLSSDDAPHILFKMVSDTLGSPDILINNACYDIPAPFVDLTGDVLDRHYTVNMRAAALLCSEFAKLPRRSKDGLIINIISGQSLGAMSVEQISYTITKAGLEMLTKQLAPELASRGIRIYAVDPGPTNTSGRTGGERKRVNDPLRRRAGAPEDFARMVVSLSIPHPAAPTGAVIHART